MPNLTEAHNELKTLALLLGDFPHVKAPTPSAEREQRDPLNPNGVDMRRFEKQAKKRLAPALNSWRIAITKGLTTGTMSMAPARVRATSGKVAKLLTELLTEFAIAGSEQGRETVEKAIFGVKQEFGINWELANAQAARWAARNATQLINEMINSRRQDIQGFVSSIIQDGGTIGDLTKRIIQSGAYSDSRAEMIAVTELTAAFANGNKIAWRESGVVEGQEWRTNEDEIVAQCPICFPLNEDVVPLDGQFVNEDLGLTFSNPPAHPRCRCWVVPALDLPQAIRQLTKMMDMPRYDHLNVGEIRMHMINVYKRHESYNGDYD